MASGKGTYLANALLSSVLRAVAFPSIVTLYLSLYTVAPTAANASGTEITGVGSYVRKSITAGTGEWGAPSGGVTSNTNAQAFITASADWGVILAAAIYDASTTGNELYFGLLTASKTVSNGDTAQFNAAAISITEA